MLKMKSLVLFSLGTVLVGTTAMAAAAAEGAPAQPRTKETKVAATESAGWRSLFDGKTLTGWKESDFAGRGAVIVTNGEIVLKQGYMTGITWTNEADLLRMNYEISLEAKRVEGSDFFCGLTFPVGKDPCSLIVGGWGGSLVGISCLDGEDAANNETTKSMNFEQNRWYHIRVQVRPKKLLAWIDDEKLVDVDIEDRRIGIRIEMEACVPLGVATWSTTGALRNFRVRPLPPEAK